MKRAIWIRGLCLLAVLCLLGAAVPAAAAEETPLSVEVEFQRMDHSIFDDRGTIRLYYDLAAVSENYPLHEQVNDLLAGEYRQYVEDIQGLEENLGYGADELFYTKTGEVTFDRDGVLSLLYSMEWFMGGVYNAGWHGITIDLATGETASLDALLDIDGDSLMDALRGIILDYARKNGGWDEDELLATIGGYTLEGLDYYIAGDGELYICIPEYELAPGAAGPMRIPCGLYVGEAPGEEEPSLLEILMSPSGGAAEGLEPQEVALSPSEQYEINIFLSNFAEQNFSQYPGPAADLVAKQVTFVHRFLKINSGDAIFYTQRNGTSYETLTRERVNQVLDRFFGTSLTDETAREEYRSSDYSFYQEDAFYFLAADGETYNRFAVADSMFHVADDLYFVRATVYGLDYEVYFNEGLTRRYYEMTPAEAAAAPELEEAALCAAIVTPFNNNGRATYRLLEWVTW